MSWAETDHTDQGAELQYEADHQPESDGGYVTSSPYSSLNIYPQGPIQNTSNSGVSN